LRLAQANAKLNGVAEKIRFSRGDLQGPLTGTPELVMANLPYICAQDYARLPKEVRSQPRSSLLAQRFGLGHFKRLLSELTLKSGGRVMLEIGFDQARGVQSLCSGNSDLLYERTVKDLAGHDRVAVIAAT
ncbi:MAG: peptide chain release factor N(5)-glutamine methyltransferase, partial [Chloroflexota bacterium]|nr:peptide chain release factor N(5)-glutamine methyltransferase [Chloroflexota bacterium]